MSFLCEAVRTPRGKAKPDGGMAGVTALDMTTSLLTELVSRSDIEDSAVDDIVLGCATQAGEQGGNIAKTAALMSGMSPSVPGVTINRFCASGIDAVNIASHMVDAGAADLVVAGGVESVSRVPMFADDGPLWSDPRVAEETGFVHMGIAADLVATLEGFDRDQLDEYGVGSHHRAARAWNDGRFDRSVVMVPGSDLATDEHVRADSSVEASAQMSPAFTEIGAAGMDQICLNRYPEIAEVRHLHHRANSPSLADGAGAVLVASEDAVSRHGLKPRARVLATATASVDPVIMLTAGQLAVEQALERAGLTAGDVDLFEFAEAFAALCLKFQRDLDVDPERFNVNGGTIAMGHAFGATGAILTACLLDEMERRSSRYGVAAVSGAAGLGVATVVERV